ncbi:unnamed protein product [Calypogeia fissa]
MARLGSFLVDVLLVVSMLHAVSDAKRDPTQLRTSARLNFVPAIRLSGFSESTCFPPDMRDDMYVVVPKSLFKSGRACNKTLKVSCAEPYKDLGGPWRVCRSAETFSLRVIDQVLDDPMRDDLFHLSGKAFWKMAYPDSDSIRLIIHK